MRVAFRARRLAPAVIIVLLVAPCGADAHLNSGVVATDYRATVDRLPRSAAGAIRVRISPSDRAVVLTVAGRDSVNVLGSSGAAIVEIDNRRSSDSRTVVWHDARLAGLPAGVQRGHWRVPLVVDGEQTWIEGALWRVRAPPAWPWLLMGFPFIGATALVLHGPRRRWTPACFVFAGVAVLATAVIAVSFGASGSASAGLELEAFDELAVAAVALGVLLLGSSEARRGAAVAIGFLAVFAGGLKVSVLGHGVVLAALPAVAARAGVALAVWSGIAAILLGASLLASSLRVDGTQLLQRAPSDV